VFPSGGIGVVVGAPVAAAGAGSVSVDVDDVVVVRSVIVVFDGTEYGVSVFVILWEIAGSYC